jgi:endonuclease/exonuclease/phosphatase family metal-dependent hydrolase
MLVSVRRFLACAGFAFLSLACGERPLEPRDPTPGVPHYIVKSYNIEAGDHDDSGTVYAVGAGKADVIFLQEVTPEWEDVIRAKYSERYPHQLFKANIPDPGAAGLGVISKFPVRDSEWHPGPNGWYPAWHVYVDTPTGAFQVFNVHLRSGHTGNGNVIQSYLSAGDDHVSHLQTFVEECFNGTPTIVLGDFNEGIDGDAVQYLEDRGFRNALPLYHPGQSTWRHDSIANQFSQTLDHILFDSSFEPLDSWIQNIGHSDHIPVLVHVEQAYEWDPLPEPPPASGVAKLATQPLY